jgi:hypothetical protein
MLITIRAFSAMTRNSHRIGPAPWVVPVDLHAKASRHHYGFREYRHVDKRLEKRDGSKSG